MSNDLEVAKLAIMAAGQVGSDERGWQLRVAQLTMQIGGMLRSQSEDYRELATSPVVVARKVLEADVYRAEFVSFSDEEMERTHRLLVRVKPEYGKPKYLDADGCEWLRTEPRWTSAGFVMQRFIKNLAPTTPILVYKYVEGFTSKGADDDEDKKSRVLCHIEITGKPRVSSADGPRQATPSPPRAPAGGEAGGQHRVPPPDVDRPADHEHNDAIASRFARLNARQQVAFGRACRGRDINDFMNPSPENIDVVLVLLGQIEKGQEATV